MSLLCQSNFENITHMAHSHRKKITRKSCSIMTKSRTPTLEHRYRREHDDATVNTLLHLNNCTIIMRLQSDDTFLTPLLDILAEAPMEKPKDSSKIEDAVNLLHNMYHLANNLQMEDRDTFYHTMRSRGRSGWALMERLLSLKYLSHNARLKCLQIVSYAVLHKPYSFHEFVAIVIRADNRNSRITTKRTIARTNPKRGNERRDLNMLFKNNVRPHRVCFGS